MDRKKGKTPSDPRPVRDGRLPRRERLRKAVETKQLKAKKTITVKKTQDTSKTTEQIAQRPHVKEVCTAKLLDRLSTTLGFWNDISTSSRSIKNRSNVARKILRKQLWRKESVNVNSKKDKNSNATSSMSTIKGGKKSVKQVSDTKKSAKSISEPSSSKIPLPLSELKRLQTTEGFWSPSFTSLVSSPDEETSKDIGNDSQSKTPLSAKELKRLQTTKGVWSPNLGPSTSLSSAQHSSRDGSPSSATSSLDRSTRRGVGKSDKGMVFSEYDRSASSTTPISTSTPNPPPDLTSGGNTRKSRAQLPVLKKSPKLEFQSEDSEKKSLQDKDKRFMKRNLKVSPTSITTDNKTPLSLRRKEKMSPTTEHKTPLSSQKKERGSPVIDSKTPLSAKKKEKSVVTENTIPLLSQRRRATTLVTDSKTEPPSQTKGKAPPTAQNKTALSVQKRGNISLVNDNKTLPSSQRNIKTPMSSQREIVTESPSQKDFEASPGRREQPRRSIKKDKEVLPMSEHEVGKKEHSSQKRNNQPPDISLGNRGKDKPLSEDMHCEPTGGEKLMTTESDMEISVSHSLVATRKQLKRRDPPRTTRQSFASKRLLKSASSLNPFGLRALKRKRDNIRTQSDLPNAKRLKGSTLKLRSKEELKPFFNAPISSAKHSSPLTRSKEDSKSNHRSSLKDVASTKLSTPQTRSKEENKMSPNALLNDMSSTKLLTPKTRSLDGNNPNPNALSTKLPSTRKTAKLENQNVKPDSASQEKHRNTRDQGTPRLKSNTVARKVRNTLGETKDVKVAEETVAPKPKRELGISSLVKSNELKRLETTQGFWSPPEISSILSPQRLRKTMRQKSPPKSPTRQKSSLLQHREKMLQNLKKAAKIKKDKANGAKSDLPAFSGEAMAQPKKLDFMGQHQSTQTNDIKLHMSDAQMKGAKSDMGTKSWGRGRKKFVDQMRRHGYLMSEVIKNSKRLLSKRKMASIMPSKPCRSNSDKEMRCASPVTSSAFGNIFDIMASSPEMSGPTSATSNDSSRDQDPNSVFSASLEKVEKIKSDGNEKEMSNANTFEVKEAVKERDEKLDNVEQLNSNADNYSESDNKPLSSAEDSKAESVNENIQLQSNDIVGCVDGVDDHVIRDLYSKVSDSSVVKGVEEESLTSCDADGDIEIGVESSIKDTNHNESFEKLDTEIEKEMGSISEMKTSLLTTVEGKDSNLGSAVSNSESDSNVDTNNRGKTTESNVSTILDTLEPCPIVDQETVEPGASSPLKDVKSVSGNSEEEIDMSVLKEDAVSDSISLDVGESTGRTHFMGQEALCAIAPDKTDIVASLDVKDELLVEQTPGDGKELQSGLQAVSLESDVGEEVNKAQYAMIESFVKESESVMAMDTSTDLDNIKPIATNPAVLPLSGVKELRDESIPTQLSPKTSSEDTSEMGGGNIAGEIFNSCLDDCDKAQSNGNANNDEEFVVTREATSSKVTVPPVLDSVVCVGEKECIISPKVSEYSVEKNVEEEKTDPKDDSVCQKVFAESPKGVLRRVRKYKHRKNKWQRGLCGTLSTKYKKKIKMTVGAKSTVLPAVDSNVVGQAAFVQDAGEKGDNESFDSASVVSESSEGMHSANIETDPIKQMVIQKAKKGRSRKSNQMLLRLTTEANFGNAPIVDEEPLLTRTKSGVLSVDHIESPKEVVKSGPGSMRGRGRRIAGSGNSRRGGLVRGRGRSRGWPGRGMPSRGGGEMSTTGRGTHGRKRGRPPGSKRGMMRQSYEPRFGLHNSELSENIPESASGQFAATLPLPVLKPLELMTPLDHDNPFDAPPPVLTPQFPLSFENSTKAMGEEGDMEDYDVVEESVDDMNLQLYWSDDEKSPMKKSSPPVSVIKPPVVPDELKVAAVEPEVVQKSQRKLKGKRGKPPGIKAANKFPQSKTVKTLYQPKITELVRTFEFRKKTTRSPLEMLKMKRRQEEAIYDLQEQQRRTRLIQLREKRIARLSPGADIIATSSDEEEEGDSLQAFNVKPCFVILNDFVKRLKLDERFVPRFEENESAPSPFSLEYEDDEKDEDWYADLEDIEEDDEEYDPSLEGSSKRPYIPRLKIKRIMKKSPKVKKSKVRNLVSQMKSPNEEPLKLVIKTEPKEPIDNEVEQEVAVKQTKNQIDLRTVDRSGFVGSYLDFLKERPSEGSITPFKAKKMKPIVKPAIPTKEQTPIEKDSGSQAFDSSVTNSAHASLESEKDIIKKPIHAVASLNTDGVEKANRTDVSSNTIDLDSNNKQTTKDEKSAVSSLSEDDEETLILDLSVAGSHKEEECKTSTETLIVEIPLSEKVTDGPIQPSPMDDPVTSNIISHYFSPDAKVFCSPRESVVTKFSHPLEYEKKTEYMDSSIMESDNITSIDFSGELLHARKDNSGQSAMSNDIVCGISADKLTPEQGSSNDAASGTSVNLAAGGDNQLSQMSDNVVKVKNMADEINKVMVDGSENVSGTMSDNDVAAKTRDCVVERIEDVVADRSEDVAAKSEDNIPELNVGNVPEENLNNVPDRNVDITTQSRVDSSTDQNVGIDSIKIVDVFSEKGMDVNSIKIVDVVIEKGVDHACETNVGIGADKAVLTVMEETKHYTTEENVDSAAGENLDSAAGENLDIAAGENLDNAAGENLDSAAGENLDNAAGENLDSAAEENLDSTAEIDVNTVLEGNGVSLDRAEETVAKRNEDILLGTNIVVEKKNHDINSERDINITITENITEAADEKNTDGIAEKETDIEKDVGAERNMDIINDKDGEICEKISEVNDPYTTSQTEEGEILESDEPSSQLEKTKSDSGDFLNSTKTIAEANRNVLTESSVALPATPNEDANSDVRSHVTKEHHSNNNNEDKPSPLPSSQDHIDVSNSPVHSTRAELPLPTFVGKNSKVKTIVPQDRLPSTFRYSCKRCGFITSTKLTMESHIYSHIPGAQFQCVPCQSEFCSMASAASHLKNTHSSTDHKLHITGYVDESSFYDKTDLPENLSEQDTTSGPVKSQASSGSGGGQSPPFIISVVVSGGSSTRTGRPSGPTRRFVCTHCGFSTNVKKDINQHISDLHPSQGLYACSLCNESVYSLEEDMKQHSLSVHPSRQKPYKKLPDFYDAEHLAKMEHESSQDELSSNMYRVNSVVNVNDADSSSVDHRLKAKEYLDLQEDLKEKKSAEADSTTAVDYSETNSSLENPPISTGAAEANVANDDTTCGHPEDSSVESSAIECVPTSSPSRVENAVQGGQTPSSFNSLEEPMEVDDVGVPSRGEDESNEVAEDNSLGMKIVEVISLSGQPSAFQDDEDENKASYCEDRMKDIDGPAPALSTTSTTDTSVETPVSGSSMVLSQAVVSAVEMSASSSSSSSSPPPPPQTTSTSSLLQASPTQKLSTSQVPSTKHLQSSGKEAEVDKSAALSLNTTISVPSLSSTSVSSTPTPTSGAETASASSSSPVPSSASSSLTGGLPLSYKCKACKVHTPYLLMMVKHLKSRHPSIRCFSCPYCKSNSSFVSQKQLRHHIRSQHPTMVDKNEVSLSKEAKKLVEAMVLPYNPRCTRVGNRLVLEEDIHTCTVCSVRLNSLSSVYDHLNEKHSDLFEFVCPVCQAYKNKSLHNISLHCTAQHASKLDKDEVHVSVPKYLFSILTCISSNGKYIEKALVSEASSISSSSSSSTTAKSTTPSSSRVAASTITTASSVDSHDQSSMDAKLPKSTSVNASDPTPRQQSTTSLTNQQQVSVSSAAKLQGSVKPTPGDILTNINHRPIINISSALFDTSSFIPAVAGAATLSTCKPITTTTTNPLHTESTVGQPFRPSSNSPRTASLPVLNVPSIKSRNNTSPYPSHPPHRQPSPATSTSLTPADHSEQTTSTLSNPAGPLDVEQFPEDEPNPDAFKIFNLRPMGPVVQPAAPTISPGIPTVFPPVSTVSLPMGFIPGPMVGFPAAMVIPPNLVHNAFPFAIRPGSSPSGSHPATNPALATAAATALNSTKGKIFRPTLSNSRQQQIPPSFLRPGTAPLPTSSPSQERQLLLQASSPQPSVQNVRLAHQHQHRPPPPSNVNFMHYQVSGGKPIPPNVLPIKHLQQHLHLPAQRPMEWNFQKQPSFQQMRPSMLPTNISLAQQQQQQSLSSSGYFPQQQQLQPKASSSSSSSPSPSAPAASQNQPVAKKGRRGNQMYQCPYCTHFVQLRALEVASHIQQLHPGRPVSFRKVP